MQITRLRDAIKVTVNNELLFPSGDWQMPGEAQQTLSKIVPILAPKQQAKLALQPYLAEARCISSPVQGSSPAKT